MINRDGDYQCGYCGDPLRSRKGKTASECCSVDCARAYAKDMGHPTEWRQYLETKPACTACGRPREGIYRWCNACVEAWKLVKQAS
jgi:hypothetical protein